MSEKRLGHSYIKKYSLNSDSTSINSSKSNKVIQAQNIHSNRLTDYLYYPNSSETAIQHIPSGTSLPELQESVLADKYKNDPFLKAKMEYIRSKAPKDIKPKKVALFEQLSDDCFEDANFTTLKQEKELSQKIAQISIREMLGNRHRAFK